MATEVAPQGKEVPNFLLYVPISNKTDIAYLLSPIRSTMTAEQGPDRLTTASSSVTSDIEGAVTLQRYPGDPRPVSVPTLLKESCEAGGEGQTALAVLREEEVRKNDPKFLHRFCDMIKIFNIFTAYFSIK